MRQVNTIGRRGSRKWMIRSEIVAKYQSEAIADEIIAGKMAMDEASRSAVVRDHPDTPTLQQYLVFDAESEYDQSDTILESLFSVTDSEGRGRERKKDGKRRRSSSSSSASTTDTSSDSDSGSSDKKKKKKKGKKGKKSKKSKKGKKAGKKTKEQKEKEKIKKQEKELKDQERESEKINQKARAEAKKARDSIDRVG